MKCKEIYLLFLFSLVFGMQVIHAQVVLSGKVVDGSTGDPLPGAIVSIVGTTIGTATNFDGEYILKADHSVPLTLQISYTGFETSLVEIEDDKMYLRTVLNSAILMDEVVVIEGPMTEKQKESPITTQTLDINGIKQTPSIGFYDGLGALKEVDLTSASFGFKVVNTRGFNSTSPVRSLQLIDGVDNQAPGLNFSLGNFLGVSELDILKVEIIAGASGAYYGPNAFNGVISMETKNPFIHTGLSAMVKAGGRNYLEGSLRFADVVKDRKGFDVLAYKINLFALRADDWEADNYEPITDSRVPADNPGRYDAVNIYGDEYYPLNDFTKIPGHESLYPGIESFYRTGYKETDLVDYNTENYKANLALHLRTNPSRGIESPELVLASNFGAGTTVYQGDNRFSLKDILFTQQVISYAKRDKYNFRAYYTTENAGKSYDPYFTALRLQEVSEDDLNWYKDYTNYWFDEGDIPSRMYDMGYPQIITNPWPPTFDFDSARQWLIVHSDSLTAWHTETETYANTHSEIEFLFPGTSRFDSAFQEITTKLNNEEGGTRFYDHSSLLHISGEYIFTPAYLSEIRIGGNYRLYAPDSKGTIFSDTAGTIIRNSEIGMYAGIKEKFLDQKVIGMATLRMDKNENLKSIFTPAASLIYQPGKDTYFRVGYSAAVRNPTLTEQYLWLNVGPAILAGHTTMVDSLITEESFKNYPDVLNPDSLKYFNIDPIRPERVQTFELGFRTAYKKLFYVDLTYYRNIYHDFLGYVIGITADIDRHAIIPFPTDVQVYRYSSNTSNVVKTEGFSFGLNYFLSHYFSLSGNYSYNKLRKTVEDDPIIPAYNTPEHKFNIGLNGRNLKMSNSPFLRDVGFSLNYKWIQGYTFEGSPQFTGYIPTYGLVDAQVNVHLEKSNTTLKVGASNLLDHQHIEVYGGPRVGRIIYGSVAYGF